MERSRSPLLCGVATLTALGLIGLQAGCDTGKQKGDGRGLPVLGYCEGNKAVKVKGHTTLEELIRKYTGMSDGLYRPNGFVDHSHAIAVSRIKAAAMGKRAGKFTIRNYTWFDQAPEPKPNSTVYVPANCYDKNR